MSSLSLFSLRVLRIAELLKRENVSWSVAANQGERDITALTILPY